MLTIRSILHPTDFSELAHPAFSLACSLARDFGSTLILCHIAPPPTAMVIEGIVVDVPADEVELTRAQLEEVRPPDASIPVVHRLGQGDVAQEILRIAAEEKCDMIVMGTHGRGGLSRLLMGSVAEEVMRHATCPVVTLKSPAHAELPAYTAAEALVTG